MKARRRPGVKAVRRLPTEPREIGRSIGEVLGVGPADHDPRPRPVVDSATLYRWWEVVESLGGEIVMREDDGARVVLGCVRPGIKRIADEMFELYLEISRREVSAICGGTDQASVVPLRRRGAP